MKKLVKLILALLAIVVVVAVGWHGAKRIVAPKRVVKPTVHLVAIGDSLTYGQGDEQHHGGYVGLIKPQLEKHYHNKVATVNYGVSGDRSDQIHKRINQQSQIRKDLRRADVITMTVGGNDLMQNLEKVVLESSTTKANQRIDRAGVTYRRKLRSLLAAIRQQNHHAPIFVISIYDPVYTYFPTTKIITNSMTKWDAITKSTLKAYRPAYFVDINHTMSYGQYNTKAKRRRLVHAAEKSNSAMATQRQVERIVEHRDHNLNEYISTADNFHPNHRGYQQITKRLYRSMRRHDQFEYEQR